MGRISQSSASIEKTTRTALASSTRSKNADLRADRAISGGSELAWAESFFRRQGQRQKRHLVVLLATFLIIFVVMGPSYRWKAIIVPCHPEQANRRNRRSPQAIQYCSPKPLWRTSSARNGTDRSWNRSASRTRTQSHSRSWGPLKAAKPGPKVSRQNSAARSQKRQHKRDGKRSLKPRKHWMKCTFILTIRSRASIL